MSHDVYSESMRGHYAGVTEQPATTVKPPVDTSNGRFIGLSDAEIAAKLQEEAAPLRASTHRPSAFGA